MPQQRQTEVDRAYQTLSKHYQMPPAEEFKVRLRTPEGRMEAYQSLSSHYQMPDADEFEGKMREAVQPSFGEAFIEGLRQSSAAGILGAKDAPPEPESFFPSVVRGFGELAGDIPVGIVGSSIGGSIGGAAGLLGGPAAEITVPIGAAIGQGAGFFAAPEIVKQLTGKKQKSLKNVGKEALLGGLTAGTGKLIEPFVKPAGKIAGPVLKQFAEGLAFTGGEAALSGEVPTPAQAVTGIVTPAAMELGFRGAAKIGERLKGKKSQQLPPHISIREGQQAPASPIAPFESSALINQEVYNRAKGVIDSNPYVTQSLLSDELGISLPYAKRILNQFETEKILKSPDNRGRRYSNAEPVAPPVHRASEEVVTLQKEGHKIAKPWRYILRPERVTTPNKGIFRGGRGTIEVNLEHPQAQDISSKIIGSQLYVSQRITDALAFFNKAKYGLDSKEKEMIGDAVELIGKTDSVSLNRISSLPPAVANTAKMLRNWFDSMKEDIRDSYRHKLGRDFSPTQRAAFEEAISQKPKQPGQPDVDILSVSTKHRIDPVWLTDVYNKYKAIDFWGMKDFVTKIEVGQYKVVDKTGQVRAVAETRRDAAKKLAELKKRFPTVQFSEQPIITEFREPVNPLEHRKDILLGEKDIFKALPAYARAVYKKIVVEPMDYDVRRYMDENPKLFSQNVRAAVEDQLKYAKGKYALGDQLTDQFAFRLGVKPALWSRFTSVANKITSRLLLGWRLPNYFINLFSGYEKSAIKITPPYIKRAVEFMNSPQGKRFLAEEERLGSLGLDVNLGTAGEAKSTAKWYDPVKVYSMAEPPVRKFGLAAPYVYAKEKLKLAEPEAREYARRSLRLTNLTYNTAALPAFLRSPSGKFFGQFKSYLSGELEFIHSLTPSEFAQHMLFQGAMTGARGFVLFAKSIPVLGALGLLDKLEDGINQLGDFASRGIPGMLGFDIAPSATLQIASDRIEDAAGPFASKMIDLYRNTLGSYEDTKGKLENAMDWISQLPTIARSWNDIISSIISDDGWIYRSVDGKVKKVWRPSSDYDKMLLTLGFNPIGKSKQEVALRMWREDERAAEANQEALRNRIVRKMLGQDQQSRRLAHAILNTQAKRLPDDFLQDVVSWLAVDGRLDNEELKNAAALGLTGQGLGQALRNAKTDPRLKEVMRANVMRKAKALELLNE